MRPDSSSEANRPDLTSFCIPLPGEQLFPAILDNLDEPFFLLDDAARLVWHNKACNELYRSVSGRQLDHFFDLDELLTVEQRSLFRERFNRAMNGETLHFEWKYQLSCVKWLAVSLYPFRCDDRNCTGVCGSLREITEKSIRDKELKYRALVNSLSEGVILQTTDKQVLAVNKSAAAILGLEVDELKEKGFPYPGWVLVDENEKVISHEGLFYRRNGRIHPVRNKILGIRRTNGIQWLKLNSAVVAQPQPQEPCALVVSLEDITEQQRISAEIEVLALLARETVNAVCILHLNGEMLWMNEGFTRLTGYTPEEMIGQTSRAILMGPETDMEVIERVDYCRQNGLPFKEEFLIYTKAGQKVWTRAQGQSMKLAHGNANRYFVICTDISEEKKNLQERLQYEIEQQKKITHVILQTRELERNELGRELHDNINQILAATRLQLSYCLQHFDGCEPVLHQCQENVMEAMEEIRRLSHKMVMPRFTEHSLLQVLNGLVENYRYAYGITLEFGEWQEERADVRVKEALYRIAQEQLSNIYKHAHAVRVVIRIKSDEFFAELTVEDDGVGFDPAEKKNGIGVSNIHCRAESCGGVAELVSAPGKGCKLLVRLPLGGGEAGDA